MCCYFYFQKQNQRRSDRSGASYDVPGGNGEDFRALKQFDAVGKGFNKFY